MAERLYHVYRVGEAGEGSLRTLFGAIALVSGCAAGEGELDLAQPGTAVFARVDVSSPAGPHAMLLLGEQPGDCSLFEEAQSPFFFDWDLPDVLVVWIAPAGDGDDLTGTYVDDDRADEVADPAGSLIAKAAISGGEVFYDTGGQSIDAWARFDAVDADEVKGEVDAPPAWSGRFKAENCGTFAYESGYDEYYYFL